jgi:hypothetical protein
VLGSRPEPVPEAQGGVNIMDGRITRREVLKLGAADAAGLAGLAVLPAVIAACGTSTATPASPATAVSMPSTTAQAIESAPGATPEPLGVIEDTRVVFYKSELSVINKGGVGVLLNLVAEEGPVGIRFYKGFGFGNEEVDQPWHMGYIEGKEGFEGLAILRDWGFTAALWGADGKLTVGRLDPYPPGNPPADARFHVRGTIDEVQARIDGETGQKAEIFQVTSATGLDTTHPTTPRLAVRGDGDTVLGSSRAPTALVLYDTVTGRPYAITIANGTPVAAPLET